MKKTILLIALTIFISSKMQAQCTPGANFADSTFGAWPDTTTNFPDALFNVAYSTDLNYKVPTDAGDVNIALAGNTIIDFIVDSVTGLPPGMTYSCNVANCTYAGGSNGCAQITGTCNVSGVYDVTIYVTGNVSTFLGTIPFPYSFVGYHITVGAAGLIENSSSEIKLVPNPVKDIFVIKNVNADLEKIVVLNSEGKEMISRITNSNDSEISLNVETLQTGVYFVKLSSNSNVEVLRFVKE